MNFHVAHNGFQKKASTVNAGKNEIALLETIMSTLKFISHRTGACQNIIRKA